MSGASQVMEEEEEDFYMLRPVNKTDHMQQGLNGLAFRLLLVRNCLSNCILGNSQRVTIKNSKASCLVYVS